MGGRGAACSRRATVDFLPLKILNSLIIIPLGTNLWLTEGLCRCLRLYSGVTGSDCTAVLVTVAVGVELEKRKEAMWGYCGM
jgi:hypothetical protein